MVSSEYYQQYSNQYGSGTNSKKNGHYGDSTTNNTTYYYQNKNNYPEMMANSTQEKKQFSSGVSYNGARNSTEANGVRGKEKTFSKITSFIILLSLIGLLCYTNNMKSEIKDNQTQLQYSHNRYRKLHTDFKTKNRELQREQQLIVDMKNDMDLLKQATKVGVAGIADGSSNLVDVLELIMDQHDDQAKEKQILEKSVQQMYQVDLEKRYGPGPYMVEFAVTLNNEKMFFAVETAPNDLLPHSVHTFMSMVETKAWDNSDFLFSPLHTNIVIISVDDVDGVPLNSKLTRTLTYPEYSTEHPHLSHTLGFGGRPGGPNFYINLADNSEIHGPGGQTKHNLVEEADSCFAKIIHGKDVIEKMNQAIEGKDFKCRVETIRYLKKKAQK